MDLFGNLLKNMGFTTDGNKDTSDTPEMPIFVDYSNRPSGVLTKDEQGLHGLGGLPAVDQSIKNDLEAQDILDRMASPQSKEPKSNLKSILFSEEGYRDSAYIPQRQGRAIGQSGVTLGKGVDIGQFSTQELKRMGVDSALLNKISPYVGVKGDVALKQFKNNPLALTPDEVRHINDKVVDAKMKHIEGAIKGIEKKAGRPLSENQKNALGSMVYQGITPSEFPNTFDHFFKGDLEAARKGFLNSIWAREQTPERAQRTVKALIDDVSLHQAEADLVSQGIIDSRNKAFSG